MAYIFVGLGNPGNEYDETRHNTGRILVTLVGKAFDAEWKSDKKLNSTVAKIKIGKTPVTLVLPDTFMNNSGNSIKQLVPSSKAAEKLLVFYDDLDLPFGKNKISFNRSSGGHKGLESIIKSIKTEKFARIRVGISPKTSSGKTKKPSDEGAVTKLIMGRFKEDEMKEIKKLSKKLVETVEVFISDGVQKAMTVFN
jgi:PTH1 family peptidyl-tRNA hydrolase